MSYGIQHKNTKKWISTTHTREDGSTWFALADREVGGVWVKTEGEAREYMREHGVPEGQYRVYSYERDRKERWFKENEKQLLENGWQKVGRSIYRSDGTLFLK